MGRNRKRAGTGAVAPKPTQSLSRQQVYGNYAIDPVTGEERSYFIDEQGNPVLVEMLINQLARENGFDVLRSTGVQASNRIRGFRKQYDDGSYLDVFPNERSYDTFNTARFTAYMYDPLGREYRTGQFQADPGHTPTIDNMFAAARDWERLNRWEIPVIDEEQALRQEMSGWDREGEHRQFQPGGIARAWNRTSARELNNILQFDASDNVLFANLSRVPIPREYFGEPNPKRPALDRADARVLSQLYAIANQIQRDFTISVRGYGDLLTPAHDVRFRKESGAREMVHQIASIAKSLEQQIPNPLTRARVVYLADMMGGLELTRERILEAMVLTQGPATLKGRVLGRAVTRIRFAAIRLAQKINQVTGESLMSASMSSTSPPNTNTTGGRIYRQLMDIASKKHDARVRRKKEQYTDEQMSTINNN